MIKLDQSCWVFGEVDGHEKNTQQLQIMYRNLEDGIKQEFMGILENFPLKR